MQTSVPTKPATLRPAAEEPVLSPPTISRRGEPRDRHRPSWPCEGEFINEEHAGIWEATKDLPGWQDPPDSQKLYEMGYHSGGVILEIGVFGGRSAVVEVRGALAGARDRGGPAPQYYGVDIELAAMLRAGKTLEDAGLRDRCLLFHGDLAEFHRRFPITPTMVFVDGDHRYEGALADLDLLRTFLAPGTPVLCHDYGGVEGVRRAVDESVAAGGYEMLGCFAGSALLKAGPECPGTPAALPPEAFAAAAAALRKRYREAHPSRERYTPVGDLIADLVPRGAERARRRLLSKRAPWPYADTESAPLPRTMPDGSPWPRITVVTPSFNQGRYIEETILSVLNQGYPNLEFIVVDGGSTDETMAVLNRHRGKVSRVISEPDRGQSDAINKGFALATGEILTWLNSDDQLAPGALGAAAIAFRRSGADMIAGVCEVWRDGVLEQRHLTSCADGPLPLEDLLDLENCWMAGQFFYQPEVMFTRELWERAGGYVDTAWRYSMDYELWLRFAERGARLHVIGRPLARFRAHEAQKTAEEQGGGFRAELPAVVAAFLERTGRAAPARPREEVRGRLRVVMFNDHGYAYGAGIAHRRLARALAEAGHDVRAVSAATVDPWREYKPVTAEEIARRVGAHKPDLVVVGNLHGVGLDGSVLGRLAGEFNTAFVLHDLWLLTGRCAYPGACERYRTGCDHRCDCPGGHPELAPDLVRPAWETRRRILSGCGAAGMLTLWANSAWTLDRVEGALGEDAAGRPAAATIRFGYELEDFRPRDRALCRELLGLPQDRFILMSSASSVRDPRKGMRHLARALEIAELDDVLVVSAGRLADGEEPPIAGMRAMGYVKDRQRLAMLYAAADVFVGPSLDEAFGQVFVEAAACGTPSVGYPVGGVPEAIADGLSGRIAKRVDPEALADAIVELYTRPALREAMGRCGRLWAEAEWSMASSYHRMQTSMRAGALGERLALSRKIQLALGPVEAPAPEVVSPEDDGWTALDGVQAWEGPYPDLNLGRCRWMTGPTSELEVRVRRPGRYLFVAEVRNFTPGQRVRVMHHRNAVLETDVPVTGHAGEHRLAFEVRFAKPGAKRLRVHHWRWNTGEGRPIALLLTNFTFARTGDA